jgi:hypothetical protein
MATGGREEMEMRDFDRPDDLDDDDPEEPLLPAGQTGGDLELETNIDTGIIEPPDPGEIENRLREFLPSVSHGFIKELAKDVTVFDKAIFLKSEDIKGNKVTLRITTKNGGKFLGRTTIYKNKGGPFLLERINKEEQKYLSANRQQPLEPTIVDKQKHQADIVNLEHFIDTAVRAVERGENIQLEELRNMVESGTVTDMNGREIEGIYKSFTTMRDNISLAKAKLEIAARNLTKAEKDLTEAKQNGNARDMERWEIEVNRLRNDKDAASDSLGILQGRFKVQSSRLKDLLLMMRNRTIPLGERIRILFREEGITIASIITAVGMTISSIALGIRLALTPSYSPTPPPGPSPSGKSFGDKVKDALTRFKNFLLDVASKSASAIPGLIGSIVSFILKSIGKVVGFVAEHLIIVVITIVALIFEIIIYEINKKRK